MEEKAREVLYETRHHASRPCSSNYPPQHQQPNEGVKKSLLSLVSSRGFSQLKEKWTEYSHPKKLRKQISLFISRRGEYVAVAVGSQLTILKKEDDYQEPCGFFTTGVHGTFMCGTWSEPHNVLGVADDTDVLYFIRVNGEEITRITKRHLKVSKPIIGLIAQDDTDIEIPCLCTFNVLVADGSLHHIDISQDPCVSISSPQTLTTVSNLKMKFPQNSICLDYHPDSSLLAIVSCADSISQSAGIAGSCSLSFWRKVGNLDIQPVSFTEFEGLYLKPKGYAGHLTFPKVQISPKCKFVATLDLRGCLFIFKLDEETYSMVNICRGEQYGSQATNATSGREGESLNDLLDFTWWSDQFVTLAKRNGVITMLDILTGCQISKSDLLFSLPVLDRVQQFPGHVFLLETSSSKESHVIFDDKATSGHIELVTEDKYNQFDIVNMHWSLISFSRRSVSELYEIYISNQKYQAALDFANLHELDKDEVLKSQWLHSKQERNDINMFLSIIRDKKFVLAECEKRVGPTEDAVKALLAYGLHLTNQYKFSESDDSEHSQIWVFRLVRLKLLQFRDRLETFLGINMGRFSVQEYSKFRSIPINEAAVVLAETGKIGALNLLFKRHLYSLTPFMLEILAAIPETVPVQTYGQLLPGCSPPPSTVRERDWVECKKMITFINRLPANYDGIVQIRTEPIVEQCLGFSWPTSCELSGWYRNRARDIDSLSGQLENCLSLVDFAFRKGINELKQFHEDISYLHQLIYSDVGDDEINFSITLIAWEQLSDYDKFKVMLRGFKEENIIEKLYNEAIPFMQNRFCPTSPVYGNELSNNNSAVDEKAESFLVRWLKEIALENHLDVCLLVFEEGVKEISYNGIFKDEVEVVDCALQCIYSSTATDRWNTMASILSKLPQVQDSEICRGDLDKRLKLAEGHIEAGRLLAFYQVPKPISFLLEHSDDKSVKQILRLVLSKFIRKQPGRSDNDWASMWRDIKSLHEKAFPYMDLEYMLMEFCRGLLKAGKFSLARNYLKGTGSVSLSSDKAESLVIQAAREYFFSASSLSCSEIWKAKECLNLLPSSRNVRAEANIIEALTLKLPKLGINLLPMQFRQIQDPMEIIKLAITSQSGAYLNVDELIEIAKLLGLSSQDEISTIQEAIAREAAVAGDLQLAFDQCLILAKKGHGPIWDLCAAIARGPALENMDINSRKRLLSFALSNCDDESIGELLHAWKDLDMEGQCETLMTLTETVPPNFSFYDQEVLISDVKKILSCVAKDVLSGENGTRWESLEENGKVLSFAGSRLPWLFEFSSKQYSSVNTVRMHAIVTILSWLARNSFVPKDDVIASLARSIMEPPVTEDEDIMGCSFLLNLVDAFHGVDIIEEQVKAREKFHEISSIMNVGMIYSALNNSGIQCNGPAQRRELLTRKFREQHESHSSDELDRIEMAQSTFWREWKLKLEEQKRVADQSRVVEQIIPGVETTRFLSGDLEYIESVVLSLAESVKFEKKHILNDLLKLADTYQLNRSKILLHHLSSILVSEVWTGDDIVAEISEVKGEILACAAHAIKTISSSIYPAIDGHDKKRLAYLYGLLSECYLHAQSEETKESFPVFNPDEVHFTIHSLGRFYKVVEQECNRVSFIKDLNFKNIAQLGGLNFESFNAEIYAHINGSTVESLARMVESLGSIYEVSFPEGLISWQDVYKQYILSLLTTLEKNSAKADIQFDYLSALEECYDICMQYIRVMAYPDALQMTKRFFKAIVPLKSSFTSLSDGSTCRDFIIRLIKFWLRMIANMHQNEEDFCLECLVKCLDVFGMLIMEAQVTPTQGCESIFEYLNHGLTSDISVEIFVFCRAMVFSGCGFYAVAQVFSEAVSHILLMNLTSGRYIDDIRDLPRFYLGLLETILQDMATETWKDPTGLHRLLSSLSRIEGGDREVLGMVRHAVWERMAKFSDDLNLPSHIRVNALELMQFVADRGRNFEPHSDILPWEGWDGIHNISSNRESITGHGVPDQPEGASSFTSTLVALRSSQLGSAISPSIEITPTDLLTVESAASRFTVLCNAANSTTHFDALLSILEEWEPLFTNRREKDDSDGGNLWNSDGWDDGWEDHVEPDVEKGESPSLHPLHACWMEISKKLVSLSRFRDLLRIIDQSGKSCRVLLVEDDARVLSESLLGMDCFVALKVVLLLPYEKLQVQCLEEVENMLKKGDGVSDAVGRDLEFLVLILSSGIISTIITKSSSSFDTTFSFVCYMVGRFSRQCQESEKKELLVFGRLLFPCFISELVMADQSILAGFLVTKFMHTNASLSLVNIAEASLKRFLERRLQALSSSAEEELSVCLPLLVNTVSSLRGRLGTLIQSALSALPTNIR